MKFAHLKEGYGHSARSRARHYCIPSTRRTIGLVQFKLVNRNCRSRELLLLPVSRMLTPIIVHAILLALEGKQPVLRH